MAYPYIQVVVVSADERRVWFRTEQSQPEHDVLEGLSEDLHLRTAGAFSLGLEDLDLGVIRLKMSPVYEAEQIGMSAEDAVKEIEDVICEAAIKPGQPAEA